LSVLVFMVLRALRWQFLLNGGSNKGHAGFWSVFHIQNIGYMVSNLMPFRAGDLARALLIGNTPNLTTSRGLSTMIVERILDLLFMALLFPLTVGVASDVPAEVQTAVIGAGLLSLGLIVVLIAAVNKRTWATRFADRLLSTMSFLDERVWQERLNEILNGFTPLSQWRKGLVLTFLSIIVWLPIFVGYGLGMLAVGLRASVLESMFVVCIAAFSVAIPSSPGQTGVFEAGVTLAIAGLLKMDQAKAASFAFLYHAINYLVLGLLGALGVYATGSTLGSILSTVRNLINAGKGSG